MAVSKTMSNPLAVILTAVILACGLAVAAGACGTPSVSDSQADSGEKVTVRLLKDPVEVPAFSATDLDGRMLSSAEWRGKVVLVNFWATWCAPCRIEIPDLIALQQEYQDELVVLGISEDEGDTALVKRYASEHNINYPIVMATPELRTVFPGVMALPTTFVIDREGKLAQKTVGLVSRRETEATTRLLAGLPTNTEVVRVEPDKAIGVDNVAQVKTIPGVDLAALALSRRTEALLALNEEPCTCGCSLTVAKCRIDDPACPVSLPLAKTIVERLASASP